MSVQPSDTDVRDFWFKRADESGTESIWVDDPVWADSEDEA